MEASQGGSAVGILTGRRAGGFQEAPVRPRICVGPGRALYTGPGLELAPHFNLATTIAVSLSQPFELRIWRASGGWTEWRSRVVEVIPSETLHHLKSSGTMAFLYLDPLADSGNPLNEETLRLGRERMQASWQEAGINEAFVAFGLVGRLPRDARIARVLVEIDRRPAAFGRLHDAAALACLSSSRFRARFNAEVGLPFRRYRLWRRMAAVMRAIAAGGNLTDAALASGFSSSAHLSSAFKRMFGLAASDLVALGVEIDVSQDEVVLGQGSTGRGQASALRCA